MSIGMTIKKLRTEKGMTQEELGALLGVKKAAVQKWESGQVQNLKHATIKRLCEVFEKNPTVFIFTENEMMCNERIRREVSLLEEMQKTYGKEVIELISVFIELDETHRAKVMDYTYDVSVIQSVISESIDD